VVRDSVYLDTASTSPTPQFIAEAISGFFDEKEKGYITQGWNEKEQQCRNQLSAQMNIAGDEIVFTSNTTEGINLVANSINWKSGDEIIISHINFPSNVYPWLNLRDRGVSIQVAESKDGQLPTENIKKLISERTRVISLPHVSSATGYKINLDELGKIAQDNNIFFNVDGIQALGYCRPNLEHVDAYHASVFKWLLSPFGLGVSYFDKNAVDELCPCFVGYGSVKEGAEYKYNDFEFKKDPQKFQYAHVNYPAIYCLSRSLEYMNNIGVENIHDRVINITKYMIERLRESGISVVTPIENHGGIVTFKTESETNRIVELLEQSGIYVAQRDDLIRASCHFYNNRGDVDDMIKNINQIGQQKY